MKVQTYHYISKGPEETREFAEHLGRLLKPGDLLALEGDLGAGKTTFSQGLAKGLGVEETIDSPTFTIMKSYQGRYPFYHMDVYRLDGEEDAFDLEEYFYGNGVCLVEWASRISTMLPPETISVQIDIMESGDRQIMIELDTKRAKEISKELPSK